MVKLNELKSSGNLCDILLRILVVSIHTFTPIVIISLYKINTTYFNDDKSNNKKQAVTKEMKNN